MLRLIIIVTTITFEANLNAARRRHCFSLMARNNRAENDAISKARSVLYCTYRNIPVWDRLFLPFLRGVGRNTSSQRPFASRSRRLNIQLKKSRPQCSASVLL